MHIDHIIPLAADGMSDETNLWLSCPLCNGYKGAKTDAIDPESGVIVPLFNPRTQSWAEHFQWSEDGLAIIGITAIGRATVVAVQLNNPFLTQARRRWVLAGWHPPRD
jgi:hypothetical protein